MKEELRKLGVNESTFPALMAEIEATSHWRMAASAATRRMAAETIHCYGSLEAARANISWTPGLGVREWGKEVHQRKTTKWWHCLDPADTEWPPHPGPPRALFGGGWGEADTLQARLAAGQSRDKA